MSDINDYNETKISDFLTSYSNFRSGAEFNTTYMGIVDMYGQIIGSDYSSTVRVFVNSSYNKNAEANIYPPIVEGTNSFDVKGGVVELSNIKFYGTPGT